MRSPGLPLLVLVMIFGSLVTGSAIALGQSSSVQLEQLRAFEGNWFGTWRSARGNTGLIGIVIELDLVTNQLKGSFFEVGRLTSKWQAIGQINEKGQIVFPGDDFPGDKRTDIVVLEEGGRVLRGEYKYQRSSSTGTFRLDKR